MNEYKPYCCPKCKADNLEILNDKIQCAQCGYCGYLSEKNVPEFLYLPDSQDTEGKKVDDDYVPADPFRKFKAYGSMQYFVNLLIKEMRKIKVTMGSLRILDVGAFMYNDITFKPFFEEIRPEIAQYWAIDPSGDTFNDSFELSNFYLSRAFGEYMPVPDKAVNCVICVATLDHMFDVGKFLSEAKRVLDDNGKLIIALNNNGFWMKRIFKKRAQIARERSAVVHNHFFAPAELMKILSEHGFISKKYGGYRYLSIIGNSPLFSKLVSYHVHVALMSLFDGILTRMVPDLGGNFWILAEKSDE